MATAKQKFIIKSFTTESFESTKRAWLRRTTDDFTFPTEATQLLEWAAAHLDTEVQNDSVAYGIFKDGVDVASAICEVVLHRRSARSKWMKMLKIRLSPELEKGIFEQSLEAARDVQELYKAAVIGVLKLKFEHSASTLKIYGRSSEQLAFLKTLGVVLEQAVKSHKISIHDRWLVVETVEAN